MKRFVGACRVLGLALCVSFGVSASAQVSSPTATPTPTPLPTPSLDFEGNDAGTGNTHEYPDVNGAVGSTQYVQRANMLISVYDKTTGAVLLGPVPGNYFWQGFGGPCESMDDGDTIVLYDKLANRWVLAQHAAPTTPAGALAFFCVAVSQTPDATGSYYRYIFPAVSGKSANYFPDYPKLGVWPDAYYLTYDNLDPSNNYAYINASVCALDRSNMLYGNFPRPQICHQTSGPTFHSLLPSDVDSAAAPPQAGTPNYVLNLGNQALNLWLFSVNPATWKSTFTGPTTVPVTPWGSACPADNPKCIAQPGTTQKLDPTPDRLMYRLAYRNFKGANGNELYQSWVVNHTVGGMAGAIGVRWYELRAYHDTLAVHQYGTYVPDTSDRFLGSLAMDKQGDIALGYSVSSAWVFPGIRYTMHHYNDLPGQMEAETSIQEGSAANTLNTKWGFYTSMSVDPFDDCTFWYTNQYLTVPPANGQVNWQTRIGKFKFPDCQ
jgi:hypothetical protein